MSGLFRKALLLPGIICLLGAGAWLFTRRNPPAGPLTISASLEGYLPGTWELSVENSRSAHLIVHYTAAIDRRFVLTAKQEASLRSALVRERFWKLPQDIGEQVVDGSTRKLTISESGRTHTVNIRFIAGRSAQQGEIRRALSVWNAVRGCFADEGAADLRSYDSRIMGDGRGGQLRGLIRA